ncbi:hypothetical protein D3C81_2255970 [compost metagenome]
MRIDQSGHRQHAFGFDHLRARRHLNVQVRADGGNASVDDQQVRFFVLCAGIVQAQHTSLSNMNGR